MGLITNRELKRFFSPILLMLLFASSSHARWIVYQKAQISSDQGQYLKFESINGGNIRLIFGLNPKSKGVFKKKLPVYRVDNNDLHIIKKGDSYKKLKIKPELYVSWIISTNETLSEELKELMNGQEVVFQYYRDDGKIMEAVFPLDGIKEAIEKILN